MSADRPSTTQSSTSSNSLDLPPFPLPAFTPLLALAQSTVAQFIQSSDNCKLVISEEQFQTTLDAVARDVLIAVAPQFRPYKPILCLRDSRLFVGTRLVVKEQRLHTVLASLPFTPLLDPMLQFSQRVYFGIPEALVCHWHARLSHVPANTMDDWQMNNDKTAAALVPTSFPDAERIATELKPIDKDRPGSPSSSVIANFVPQEHDVEVVLDCVSRSESYSGGLESVVSLVDETIETQVVSETGLLTSTATASSPNLSLSLPSLDENQDTSPSIHSSPSHPSLSPLNDVPALNCPPLSTPDSLVQDNSSAVSEPAVPAVWSNLVSTLELPGDSTSGVEHSFSPSPTRPSTQRSKKLEEGQELEEQQTEWTTQTYPDQAPSDNIVNQRYNAVLTPAPFSVAHFTSFESPTPATGARQGRRVLREKKHAREVVAAERMPSGADEDGQRQATTSSVHGGGRKRAREEGADESEQEDGQEAPRRKRGRWGGAVSRAWHFVTKPFDFGDWRHRQS